MSKQWGHGFWTGEADSYNRGWRDGGVYDKPVIVKKIGPVVAGGAEGYVIVKLCSKQSHDGGHTVMKRGTCRKCGSSVSWKKGNKPGDCPYCGKKFKKVKDW